MTGAVPLVLALSLLGDRVKAPSFRSAYRDSIGDAILSVAKRRKCDLIVMASHGRRGLKGVLIGSETQKVLTHTRSPVLVCR
jgi:nucleotide-binding universal stress UspA family protein